MDCRKCGACCIAPSITTPIPNMPRGKPAGARCANLSDRNECTLYAKAARPAFCIGWQPMPEVCGQGFQEAMTRITRLEQATAGEGSRSLPGQPTSTQYLSCEVRDYRT